MVSLPYYRSDLFIRPSSISGARQIRFRAQSRAQIRAGSRPIMGPTSACQRHCLPISLRSALSLLSPTLDPPYAMVFYSLLHILTYCPWSTRDHAERVETRTNGSSSRKSYVRLRRESIVCLLLSQSPATTSLS